jgi:hypothetical protein
MAALRAVPLIPNSMSLTMFSQRITTIATAMTANPTTMRTMCLGFIVPPGLPPRIALITVQGRTARPARPGCPSRAGERSCRSWRSRGRLRFLSPPASLRVVLHARERVHPPFATGPPSSVSGLAPIAGGRGRWSGLRRSCLGATRMDQPGHADRFRNLPNADIQAGAGELRVTMYPRNFSDSSSCSHPSARDRLSTTALPGTG